MIGFYGAVISISALLFLFFLLCFDNVFFKAYLACGGISAFFVSAFTFSIYESRFKKTVFKIFVFIGLAALSATIFYYAMAASYEGSFQFDLYFVNISSDYWRSLGEAGSIMLLSLVALASLFGGEVGSMRSESFFEK